MLNSIKREKIDRSILKNREIKEIYFAKVHNMFESLQNDDETITITYVKLIQANEETTQDLIPKKVKTKETNIAKDQRMQENMFKIILKTLIMQTGLQCMKKKKPCKIIMIMLLMKCLKE